VIGEQTLVPPGCLDSLQVLSLRFDCQALRGLHLPGFAGSAFRGLLGHALKAAACRRTPVCSDCVWPEGCAYACLFETSAPRAQGYRRGSDEVPRPFVLRPPAARGTLGAGQAFSLGLQLFGPAVRHLPLFLHCVEEMGRRGVGQVQAPFRVLSVAEVPACGRGGKIFYVAGRVLHEPAAWTLGQVNTGPAAGDQVTVRFLTPTRLVHQGQLVLRPEFHVLVRALLRRLDLLLWVHGAGPLAVDFREAARRAAEVRLEEGRLGWFDWERHSSRQKRSHPLGGVVGTALYRGPVAPFWPLLVAGSVVHVGKATTFGMGQIEVQAGP
jgi:CRISPR/Cas system endoribonuclease Cas6 (RAMP superfamily)